jgi:hypothetical protein
MLTTTASRANYVGTGSTGPFAIPYRVTSAADLRVTRRSSAGIETLLANGTDFNVSGVPGATATLTLVAALAVGETITIRRAPDLTQTTSIRNQGPYFPATHEDTFDRLVMQLQSLQDQFDRSFKLTETNDPAAYNMAIPVPTAGYAVVGTGTGLTMAALSTAAIALPGQGRTVTTVSSYIANNAVFNFLDFAPIGVTINDGVGDSTSAIVLAAANLPAFGGKILLSGRPVISSEIVLNRPVLFEHVGPKMGASWAGSTERGGYILLGAAIAGAMFRFALPASAIETQGSGFKNVSIYGNARGFAVGSAIHIERSKPAIDLDPSGGNYVQGSSFVQVSVETCYNAEYFKCSANVQTNKFDHLGFEAVPTDATTLNKFFVMAGERNQIGIMHLNQLDATATVPKMEVSGQFNTFANLLFAGRKSSTAGDLLCSGHYNNFGLVEIFGYIGFTETFKSLIVSGTVNHFDSVISSLSGEPSITGDYNSFGSYKSVNNSAQFLVSGFYCEFEQLEFISSAYAGDLVLLSGIRPTAKVRIVNAPNATSGVKISLSAKLMPGSFIFGITNGHGVWITNNLGSVDGVDVDTVGKHGIFIDNADPLSISNNRVKDASGLAAGTYDGISFQSTTTRSTGGTCNGNRVWMTTTTHRHAFFVTDNAGTPRYQNWTFVGNNHTSGGDFSVSVGTNIIASNRS